MNRSREEPLLRAELEKERVPTRIKVSSVRRLLSSGGWGAHDKITDGPLRVTQHHGPL